MQQILQNKCCVTNRHMQGHLLKCSTIFQRPPWLPYGWYLRKKCNRYISSSKSSSGKSPTSTNAGFTNEPYFGGHSKYLFPLTLYNNNENTDMNFADSSNIHELNIAHLFSCTTLYANPNILSEQKIGNGFVHKPPIVFSNWLITFYSNPPSRFKLCLS